MMLLPISRRFKLRRHGYWPGRLEVSNPMHGAVSAVSPIDLHTQGHHLLAFRSTLAAQAGYQQVNAIADPLFPVSNNEYQIFDEYQIATAYAGGAAVVRAHLKTASISLRGTAHVVPIQLNSGGQALGVNPNILAQPNAPLNLRIGENVRAEMESNSATKVLMAIWMIRRGHDFGVEFRDLRWLRLTVTGTSVTDVWTNLGTMTLEDQLEGGDYACYGMNCFDANGTGLLARLVFPSGQVMRPGCLVMPAATSHPPEVTQGGLGLFGVFNFLAIPGLEVLDGTGASNTFTVWLLCSNTKGVAADLA